MKKYNCLRKIIGLLAILTITVSCGPCKSKKSPQAFTLQTPFTIDEIYSQKWVAGIKEGGSGINVYASITGISNGVTMKEFYYRDKITSVENKNETEYVAYFKDTKNDIVMDGDSKNEAVNTPPVKFPFQLEYNEAVLSYEFNNKTHYHKISNIKEKEIKAYPSVKPKN